MAPTDAVEPVDFVPKRAVPIAAPAPAAMAVPVPVGPLRIRGRVGDGLYWSLRAAGASPQAAAQYLAALATEIDVGEVGPSDGFDLVLGADRQLLYAGLSRAMSSSLELVRWTANGRSEWIDAANPARPAPSVGGLMMPANGPVTSYFGYRYHPILHFTRFHAGIDIGAGWGSPIVAAADGQVVGAGWGGGYGREVQIARDEDRRARSHLDGDGVGDFLRRHPLKFMPRAASPCQPTLPSVHSVLHGRGPGHRLV